MNLIESTLPRSEKGGCLPVHLREAERAKRTFAKPMLIGGEQRLQTKLTLLPTFPAEGKEYSLPKAEEDAMASLVRERSKITSKGQTTVPKAVRQALGVSYGGEIAYVVDEGGRVSLLRAEEETDPVIDGFLTFLARDMTRNPADVTAFPTALAERMAALTAGINVDLNEEIDGAVTL